MHTRISLDPRAMCIIRFSLMMSLPSDNPATAFLSRRSSGLRSSPVPCIRRGRHSEGTLRDKDAKGGIPQESDYGKLPNTPVGARQLNQPIFRHCRARALRAAAGSGQTVARRMYRFRFPGCRNAHEEASFPEMGYVDLERPTSPEKARPGQRRFLSRRKMRPARKITK